MPRGPRRGPPLSPNVLTERTENLDAHYCFQIIEKYIRYFYDPLYGVHEN